VAGRKFHHSAVAMASHAVRFPVQLVGDRRRFLGLRVTNPAHLLSALRVIGGQGSDFAITMALAAGGLAFKRMSDHRRLLGLLVADGANVGRSAVGVARGKREQLPGAVAGSAVGLAVERMGDPGRTSGQWFVTGLAGIIRAPFVIQWHRPYYQSSMACQTIVTSFGAVRDDRSRALFLNWRRQSTL
jgi:hypothetical protein